MVYAISATTDCEKHQQYQKIITDVDFLGCGQ